jgi:hypothetical protein
MRVAFIKNKVVVNVIEVENIEQLPEEFVVAVDEQGNIIKKTECELSIETKVGSRNDLYEHEVGFYRQHNANIESIEQVDVDSIEEL